MTHPRLPRVALFGAVFLIILLLWLAGPAARPAHANGLQQSVMQDDDLLLYRGNTVMQSTLRRMKAAGVDTVRVTVLWSVVAQNIKKRPKDPSNPRSYPQGNWSKFDSLAVVAQQMGINVLFNLTGPGPPWVHQKSPVKQVAKSWKPNAGEFAKFVEAVGKRYSGTYKVGSFVPPRVTMWSLWNEPNQGPWLAPQYAKDPTLSKQIAMSPILYRELYLRGRKALDASGHGNDTILLGETAPLGDPKGRKNERKAMAPVEFIRELFCVAPNGRMYKGNEAKARKCDQFKTLGPLRASGFAHHPYTRSDPPTKPPRAGGYTMGNISKLVSDLDKYAKFGNLQVGGDPKNRTLPVWSTEYGYETNPPDPVNGITEALQAQYINEGDFIAYQNPRIMSQSQFLLRDVPPVTKGTKKNSAAYWFTYQSGLFTMPPQDKPKPAYQAYIMPLVATIARRSGAGGTVNLWGQLRFRPNGTLGDQVVLQYRPQGGTDWTTVGDPVSANGLGFFLAQRDAPVSGSWRAVWAGENYGFTGFVFSREVLLKFER
jgi:Cellulase (glycosyl hydrolase family 5)